MGWKDIRKIDEKVSDARRGYSPAARRYGRSSADVHLLGDNSTNSSFGHFFVLLRLWALWDQFTLEIGTGLGYEFVAETSGLYGACKFLVCFFVYKMKTHQTKLTTFSKLFYIFCFCILLHFIRRMYIQLKINAKY